MNNVKEFLNLAIISTSVW